MPTPPRRRWFQFSLATMFVVVTACAMGLAWLAWNLMQVQGRTSLLDSLPEHAAVFAFPDDKGRLGTPSSIVVRNGDPNYSIGLVRSFMGDKRVGSVYFMDRLPTESELDALRAFPEASIYGSDFR